MELAVILVLLVLIELALTFYFLGRLRDYKRTVDGLVDTVANLDYGLDQALTSLGLASQRLNRLANDTDDSASSLLDTASKAAAGATPAEVAQAKAVLESLGIKMED